MVILLTATALAGPTTILIDYPAVRTPSLKLYQTDAAGISSQRWPDKRLLTGGLRVEHVLKDRVGEAYYIGTGAEVWTAAWERTLIEFQATSVMVPIDFGVVVSLDDYFGPSDFVFPYFKIAAGPRFTLMIPDWWDTHLTAGLGGNIGFGMGFGEGQPRVTFEGRASILARTDQYTGSVTASEGTLSWSHSPGMAALIGLIGVRL